MDDEILMKEVSDNNLLQSLALAYLCKYSGLHLVTPQVTDLFNPINASVNFKSRNILV